MSRARDTADQINRVNSSAADATAITVDSSENVGIGNTSSGYIFSSGEKRLSVGDGTEHAGIQVLSGTNKWGGLEFADDTTNANAQGLIAYYHPDNYMQFNTNGSQSMRIDLSGRVTTPSQPSFLVRRNGDQTGYNPNNYAHSVIFNQEEYDIGNNVSTTTGLFTAPVNGVYIFFASAYSTTNNFGQAWFTVNGGRGSASDFVKAAADAFVNCSVIFKLSANDTVGYHPHGSGTSATIKANENHTWFKGHLIG